MGKVTVKHYLNTDVQNEQIRPYNVGENGKLVLAEDEILYPVYLQITVNRKTTKLRSTIRCSLSKSDFQQYQAKETYPCEKKQRHYNPTYYLRNEISLVTTALDYFYNKQKGDQEKVSIKDVVNFYMKDFDSSYFLEFVNNETLFTIDNPKYKFIYDIIKTDASPLVVEHFFANQLKVDIYSLPLEETAGDWGDAYKSVSLFLALMPKDKEGKVIGKAVNWFCGNMRENFRESLHTHKYDVEIYYNAFNKLCEIWERINIIQKFRFVQ